MSDSSTPVQGEGSKGDEEKSAAENPQVHDIKVAEDESEKPSDKTDTVNEEKLRQGQVVVSGKRKQLTLTSQGFTLTDQGTQKKKEEIAATWRDVICAQKTGAEQEKVFLLHYIHQGSKNLKRHCSVKVEVTEGDSGSWITLIQEQCSKVPGRPKKLFVIINPIGGSTKGKHTYGKTVAPLFELAGIDVTSVVTERFRHALEIAETQDFTGYDGIIVLGGDGLVHEVLQGWFLQLQKKTGTDYNNPKASLTKSDIALGHIPTGTGNGVSGWCNGTVDVETAVLNVIRGEKNRAQILCSYADGKFICVSALTFAIGDIADLLKRTDELRWMKRARYIAGLLGLLFGKRRTFNAEVSYHQAQDRSTDNDASAGAAATGNGEEDGWVTFNSEGRSLTGVSCFACDLLEAGNHYIPTSFSDKIFLGVNTGSSNLGILKHLYEFGVFKNPMSPIENIHLFPNVNAFRIKLISDDTENPETMSAKRAKERELEHLVESDGEFYHVENFDVLVTVQPQFLPCYGITPQVPPANTKQ